MLIKLVIVVGLTCLVLLALGPLIRSIDERAALPWLAVLGAATGINALIGNYRLEKDIQKLQRQIDKINGED